MRINYNVIGKKNGVPVKMKRGLYSLSDAVKIQSEWDQHGAGMIVDDTWQIVAFDEIEIECTEVIYG